MNKILITTSSFDIRRQIAVINFLEAQGYQVVMNPFGRRCSTLELIELIDDSVVGLIAGVELLTRDVFAKAKNLKVVSRCGTGLDSVDLIAAKEFNIDVFNTPCAPASAVAELTIGLMLGLLRKIVMNDRQMRQGVWKPLMGNLLSQQTIGIVGYGRIGQKVVSLLRGFSPTILISDPYVTAAHDQRFVSMDELIENANLISLHLPATAENIHLFNERILSRMQKGSLLINTARGGIVDEDALYHKIVDGHLSGAALDVFEQEPYNGPLLNLPEILLTSHIGSYAFESRIQMEKEAMMNLMYGLKEKGLLLAHFEGITNE